MPVVGIDLGTTFSAIAYLDANGTPTTILNSEGELTTPSVVLFEKNGDVVVGREARRAALVEPERIAENVKRHMGEPFYPSAINGKKMSPVEISALILKKLKTDAEKKLGKVDGAVITVPAYFDERRRQATASAGKQAGFKVLDIINEPTSAALAYAYRDYSDARQSVEQISKSITARPDRILLVYDLGGGTLDVTLLKTQGRHLSVMATTGDVKLGGREWDERLFKVMGDNFTKANSNDPRLDRHSAQALILTAEDTKKILSSRRSAAYVINHSGKSFNGNISREEFEELTEDLLYRTESRLSRVIKQASLTWDNVDQVLAVGGSTRMPQVQAMLRRVTGKDPDLSLSPDEAVAHGAAIHAAICVVQGSQNAPMQTRNDSSIFPGDDEDDEEPGPTGEMSDVFQARVSELLGSIKTTNVNAHSLGVVTKVKGGGEHVCVLIPPNTPLPVSARKRFGTVSVNQDSAHIRVVEGESKNPAECSFVGSCRVQPLPPKLPRGSPIDVTFTYDNSGRLHVHAVEATSGASARVSIDRLADVLKDTLDLDD